MELTPKQQASEAIKAADTILVTTGRQPTVDQTAAVLALSEVLRRYGKKVTALMSDRPPNGLDFLPTNQLDHNFSGIRDFILKLDLSKAEADKLRYEVVDGKLNVFITPFRGGFAPSDVTFDYGDYHYDLVIVLGVPSKNKIDKAFDRLPQMLSNVPIVNIDFHRINEQYGAVNLVETTAASLCEMLVSLAESLQNGIIDTNIATAMLAGVIAATDRFTAQHTTPKSLTVAAQLMAAGAKQQQIVKAMYGKGDRRDDRQGKAKGTSAPGPVTGSSSPRSEAQPPRLEESRPVPPSASAQENDQAAVHRPEDNQPADDQPEDVTEFYGSVLADEPEPEYEDVNANYEV